MTRAQTPSARADLHLRALQAALSATLALGLGACAGKPTGGGPGGGALTAGDSGAAVDGADSSGLAEDSGGDAEDSGGGDLAEGCVDVAPEALADCCLDLQASCTLSFPDDFDAAYDCAFGPATGCTPWGPPVPPALA
jgi:hypothetical protein